MEDNMTFRERPRKGRDCERKRSRPRGAGKERHRKICHRELNEEPGMAGPLFPESLFKDVQKRMISESGGIKYLPT